MTASSDPRDDATHTPLPRRRGTRPPSVATPAGRHAGVAAFTMTALAALAETWALVCLGRAVGDLLTPSSTHLAGLLAQAGAAATACALLQAAVQATAWGSAATQEAALRRRVLDHLLDLGPAHTTSQRTGSTVSLLTDGAERVALYRQTFLAPTVAAALAPALCLVLLGAAVDPVPAAVLGAAVVLTPLLIGLAHSRLRASSSDSRRARMRLAAEYLDAIQGLTTLTLARAARRTQEELRARGEENRRAVMGVLAGNQLVILITDSLFSLFLITAAAGLAAWRLTSGAVGVGDALAVVLVSYVLLEPLDHVGAFFYVGMGGLANQRAVRQILATDRPRGAPDAPRAPADPGAAVRLDSVRASWGPEGPDVLHGVDLRVPTGQHLAVIGPSGSGKSTLMALLSGDLLPSGGTVRVAGTASSARTQDQVRAASALVAQTTWLFTGTIAHNLRLAAPDATREQMWAALDTVGLDAEVRRMPQGLDTVLGEQGLGLSGGQAQRLSLARAILADRPLLLLDEPTSQVDLASEAAIVAAIPRAAAGRTVVTVSHRDGALVSADRLIEVRDGRILERTDSPAPAPVGPTGSPGSSSPGPAGPTPTSAGPSGSPGTTSAGPTPPGPAPASSPGAALAGPAPTPAGSSASSGTAPAGPSGSLSASSSGSSAPGPAPFANPVPDPSQEA
ncbi:ABC transporter ATP-binding protein [Actinomyces sp. HMT897]|uniref:ABC transporter ATP-binding protein/permease n=1 Tax=Actinomyces sp. HMT897 TaxID=2789424 RepID=UPI00190A4A2C|nr:ABC transporter ATP-binding protein [Actinomyces sp. HMT897]QQO77642.1 ABC transporter ATP-binding protein [Actinomyces sp. HMT897]